ncbi:right-handed parallel beta-helix repeat-containing protein, partial [Candidatus Micrarchaeota archaeon]|nr:right-handed parallel beta-helix repeat-containing protein [Candidatus Micrarchaeota archaeon]
MVHADTAVSACGNVASAGRFNLTADLFIGNDICVNITASDVLLDCEGHMISGNRFSSETGNVGVKVNTENNVTIRNCRIQNFSSAILVSGSSNVTIYNNTLTNNTHHGVRVDTVPNNDTRIFNNTISYNSQTGIQANANSSLVYNNLFFNQSSYQIRFLGGVNNNITNNTIWNGSSTGIRIDGYTNDTYIFNNTIFNHTGASGSGILLVNSYRAYIHNNTIYNNSQYGVWIQTGAYNNVSNNTISNHSAKTAVRADGQENFTRVESNVLSNNAGGVHVLNGINFTIRNNTITFSSDYSILLQTYSHNHTVANNTIANFSQSGIRIIDQSNDSFIFQNNLSNSPSSSAIDIRSLASNNRAYLNNVSFIYGGATGIGLDNASYNNVSDNQIFNMTGTAIGFSTAASWNRVFNNILSNMTAGYGIQFASSSPNNSAYSNNISFINGTSSTAGIGIQLDNALWNNVSYNRIENVSAHSIRLQNNAAYNTIADNVLINNTLTGKRGIYLFSSAPFNNLTRNTIQFTSAGIQLDTNISNTTIVGNSITGTVTNGFDFSGSSNNTLRDNNFSYSQAGGGGVGISFTTNSQDNLLENNTVLGFQADGIRIDSSPRNVIKSGLIGSNALTSGNQTRIRNASSGIQFSNMTISGGGSHVSVNGSSSVVLTNNTLNKSLVQGESGLYNITLRWYFSARAIDFDGDGLTDINVSVANTTAAVDEFGAVNLSSTTVLGGFAYYQLVTEAFINSSGTTNTSSYNVTISRANPYNSSQIRYNSTLVNITSQDQTVTLQSNALPNVTLSSPGSGNRNSSRNVTVMFLPLDADNATFSNCSVFTNETSFSAKNSNATAVTNGSTNSILMNFSSDGDFAWNVQCYDKNGDAGFAASNFTISIDNTTPAGFGYVSPTLDNASTSMLNYSEVNASFTEVNPDSCLLEYNNGTAVNYSMTRSGNFCWKNLTVLNNGNFNYTVYANDSVGHWNNSERRFVTLSDDNTPPAVTLISPADAAVVSSQPSFVFSESDAGSSTASCLLYVDGILVGSNATVL